jgi:excisionase family DNA binding protein
VSTVLLSADPLLPPAEVAQRLGVSIGTLAVWRSAGRYGLRFVRIGRRIMYRESDVVAWLERRSVTSTGEGDALDANGHT